MYNTNFAMMTSWHGDAFEYLSYYPSMRGPLVTGGFPPSKTCGRSVCCCCCWSVFVVVVVVASVVVVVVVVSLNNRLKKQSSLDAIDVMWRQCNIPIPYRYRCSHRECHGPAQSTGKWRHLPYLNGRRWGTTLENPHNVIQEKRWRHTRAQIKTSHHGWNFGRKRCGDS